MLRLQSSWLGGMIGRPDKSDAGTTHGPALDYQTPAGRWSWYPDIDETGAVVWDDVGTVLSRVAAVFVLLVVACGGSGPTPGPTGPVSAPTRAPTAVPPLLANPTDAFVVTVGRTAGGTPNDTIVVEAVSADGVHLPIATIRDATGGLPPGTRIAEWEPMVVSPRGHLAVAAEVEEAVETLIFDLRDPSRAPFAIRAEGRLGWGPGGWLVIVGATTTFVDPVRGESLVVDGAGSTTWAADGSGVLATERGQADETIVGVLRPDGTFVAGISEPWSATGVGRPYSSAGTQVGDAGSSGPTGSNHAIIEFGGPSGDEPVPWIVVTSPGPDPSIFSYA